MNTIKIRTTQNVELEYAVASVGDRILAHLIDFAVYFMWMLITGLALNGLGLGDNVVGFIIMALPVLFYHLICEIFMNGQSIGKMARDIRVVKLSGEAPTIGDYLLRWVFRLIDIAASTGLIAIVTIAVSNKGQRLGDMAAGTSVIRKQAVRRKDHISVSTEDGYQIRFPEVNLLTDKDVALVRKLLYKAKQYNNYELLEKISQRVKEVTGIQTEMAEWDFLQTVVKDYHHYTHGDVQV
ncbi:RDD family protein [Pontibacter pamirensis]|uniref:RDD family protein n=1 Tax=Pontibacter pamirensis TaxID=2562824 RepID=UPI001389DA68|nr:RDD family protein [Pontibacter pamirensis]